VASPPVAAPRQALGSAEAAAWRRVVFVLSKTASPTKRKIMADKVGEFTQGRGAGELGLELPDVATLFHPEDPKAAAAVLATLQQACKAGVLPSHGQWLYLSQLAAWPDIPAAAADSPLRFWLPFLPKAAAPALVLVPKADAQPTTWKALLTFHKANPGHVWALELKAILAKERSRRGEQPGAANAMAIALGISTSRLNGLLRTADTPGKRQAARNQRTGTK
jgi:hypothetical protein